MGKKKHILWEISETIEKIQSSIEIYAKFLFLIHFIPAFAILQEPAQ